MGRGNVKSPGDASPPGINDLSTDEHLGEHFSIPATGDDTDADLRKARIQNVGPVSGTVHEALMSAIDSCCAGYILTCSGVFNACVFHHVKG